MDIFRNFTMEVAHAIPGLCPEHPCGRMHGHTYQIEIWLRGDIPPGQPWFYDWGDLDEPIARIVGMVDHRALNDVPGMGVPSCENLAVFIWRALVAFGVQHLFKIRINEGARSGLEYYGPARDEDWG